MTGSCTAARRSSREVLITVSRSADTVGAQRPEIALSDPRSEAPMYPQGDKESINAGGKQETVQANRTAQKR
jgi:hypothetical protein